MICRNCQAQVDDDLIFCTNCGERLSGTNAQTVLMNDSVVTKTAKETPQKSLSKIKWIALIIGLIAIPVSIYGVYLLVNASKHSQITQNVNKPNPPAQSPRKANNKQISNEKVSNTNANSANTNLNENTSTPKNKSEIMNERIEIAPKSNYALPFKITSETAKITGKVKVLEGEKIKGFVYFQKEFDEHFPDEIYKVFSFDGAKEIDVNQTLVKENYVLVFVNDGEKSVVIRGNFSVE
jgi:flagellar basal body-associated protein FliL